ncbi:hypothetical protein ABZ912_62620 [Nonomuraea angiospora]|uniref:hypothetical protein n=1 Tax=Nonomuraea angiospora TaxID=46172 RepID=UPI0033C0B588
MLRTLFQADPMEYAPAARPRYADLVRRLLMAADLLADRPVLASRTADKAVSELFGEYGRRPPLPIAVALPAARRLAGRGDLSGGLFALILTQSGGQRTEWAAPWRERLRDLRASPHPEVRQEAWDTSVD